MIPIRDRLPSRTVPFVSYTLIGANILAFIWELALIESGYSAVVHDWGFTPSLFLADPLSQSITIVTSMFLHGGWMHLLGNMLFLWVFGDNVEDALGHVRFVLFYLLGGVVAAMAQLAVEPSSAVPMVGASGAISAVLGAYLSLYPRARVLVLVPIVVFMMFFEFPAWLVIIEWFVLQLLTGLGSIGQRAGTSGVATFAHLGGFVAGLVLIRLLMIGRQAQQYDPWHGWRRQAPPRRGPMRRNRAWWDS